MPILQIILGVTFIVLGLLVFGPISPVLNFVFSFCGGFLTTTGLININR